MNLVDLIMILLNITSIILLVLVVIEYRKMIEVTRSAKCMAICKIIRTGDEVNDRT